MSIKSKLARLKDFVNSTTKTEKEVLNKYVNQDKIKQLLLESKHIDDRIMITELGSYCNIIMRKRRIDVFIAELEPVNLNDIGVQDKFTGSNFGFIKIWPSQADLTILLENDKIKVEQHQSIGDVDELIEHLDSMLFSN